MRQWVLSLAGVLGGQGQCGSVTLIQRFGSAANLNIHLHCMVLDGVYRSDAEGEPEFIEAAAPIDEVSNRPKGSRPPSCTRHILDTKCVDTPDAGHAWAMATRRPTPFISGLPLAFNN